VVRLLVHGDKLRLVLFKLFTFKFMAFMLVPGEFKLLDAIIYAGI
jgi:hypothetical protein